MLNKLIIINNKKIYVIEDCAQSFGARIDKLPVGLQEDIAIFSFGRGKLFQWEVVA